VRGRGPIPCAARVPLARPAAPRRGAARLGAPPPALPWLLVPAGGPGPPPNPAPPLGAAGAPPEGAPRGGPGGGGGGRAGGSGAVGSRDGVMRVRSSLASGVPWLGVPAGGSVEGRERRASRACAKSCTASAWSGSSSRILAHNDTTRGQSSRSFARVALAYR